MAKPNGRMARRRQEAAHRALQQEGVDPDQDLDIDPDADRGSDADFTPDRDPARLRRQAAKRALGGEEVDEMYERVAPSTVEATEDTGDTGSDTNWPVGLDTGDTGDTGDTEAVDAGREEMSSLLNALIAQGYEEDRARLYAFDEIKDLQVPTFLVNNELGEISQRWLDTGDAGDTGDTGE